MQTPEYNSQLLSLALKGAKCGVWDWDLSKDTVTFDAGYYRIAGYEPDEFPHALCEWEERVHPDDIGAAIKSIEKYLAGELENYTVEFRFKTKSGCWMWILDQGEITERDKDGKPTRFTGLHIDISQSKKVQRAFEQERAFSTSLIDTAQMIVLILDADGKIRRINPYMEELTGYKEAEVKGKDWFDTFLPSADNAAIRDVFRKAVDDIEVRGKINPIVSRDGRELLIEWYNKTLKDIDGNIFGILSIGVDITERKKAEEQLILTVEREKELADIVRKSPLAIAYGSVDGKLANCNDAFSRLTGYSLLELQQIKWNDVLTPHSWLASEDDFLSQLSPTKTSIQYEKEYIRKDGSIVPIELTVTAKFDSAGKAVNYIGFIADISVRKCAEAAQRNLEEQLQQKHKMEAVGYMAGGMAHNFNNNLSIILGNIELAQMKEPDNSEIVSLLNNAKIGVLRSRDLVKKIMSYSRKGSMCKQAVNLAEVIDETLSLLQSTLPSSVDLNFAVKSEGVRVVVNADPSQLQEVLINLCNNAVHAMAEKGALEISLENVELKAVDIPAQFEAFPGCYAKLSVQDNGCGIDAEVLDKIFDPFFTTKEEYEGAGMGLATVQGIVAQHGGIIEVASVVGQGTIFDLYFPLVDQEATSEKKGKTALVTGIEKILFVDDDPLLANLWEQLLSESGYQVTTMTDSVEALKLFRANAEHFDLVITDQTMPDLTGEELILEVKKIRPAMPTILSTGYSSKIDEKRSKELGISAFCMKPLDLPELLQIVRRVLDEGKD